MDDVKKILWTIRVKLGDLGRVMYRRIHPAKSHIVLEIQDSELKIGD
jgi:hypothetical protein